MVEPKYDTVIVVTEGELSIIENGGKVYKIVEEENDTPFGTVSYTLRDRLDGGDKLLVVNSYVRDRLRNGESIDYGSYDVSIIHEDYAGTPKSDDAIVNFLFEQFKESDGERRELALETLHKFGYEVEKDVEYNLVER